VREHNTPTMPVDLLVQYAQRKGDVCRKRHQKQQDEEDRLAEARRVRRAARPVPRKYVTVAVTAPSKVGEAPPSPSRWGPPKVGEAGPSRWGPPKAGEADPSRWGPPKVREVPPCQTRWAPAELGEVPPVPSPRNPTMVGEAPPGPPRDDTGRPGRPRTNDCLSSNMRRNFFRECPHLDAGTKALVTKAALERCEERRKKEEELRQGQPVAAVRRQYGPPWSSSDDSPSPGKGEAEQDEEDNSPSGNQ